MSIIQCIYWPVGVDVILTNKTAKEIKGEPQKFSEIFGQDSYSNVSPYRKNIHRVDKKK